MLQLIRGATGSWIAKILFVLLIVSFAYWGVGDVSLTREPRVAEVGSIEITQTQLDRAFREQLQRLRQQMGPDFSADQARQMGLLEQTLEVLIQESLMQLAAEDMGLRIGEAQVAAEIQRMDVFQDNGKFDRLRFLSLLQANNMSEAELVGSMRLDMLRSNIQGAVVVGAQVPDVLANALYRYAAEQRVAETVTLPNAMMPDPPAPDESVLKKFQEDHAVRYTAPEYRNLTAALLTVDDLAKGIEVSDEEVKQAYDARAAEFITPEKRTLSQAVLPDQATADMVAAAVKGGKSLADAAKDAKAEATLLENMTKSDLSGPFEPLAEQVFAAPANGVVGPLQTQLGWHVVTIGAITTGGERPLAEVKDQLVVEVRKERGLDKLFEAANKMDDLLAGGSTLEEAAMAVGANMIRIEQVDRSGTDPAGRKVEAAQQAILDAAFGLQEGANSAIAETADRSYFAVRADTVTPAVLKPFDEVKAQLKADWVAEQKATAAAAKAKQAVDRLAAGTPAEVVARDIGGKAATTAPLTRDPGLRGVLPPALLDDLFQLKPGQAATASTADTQVIARLREVIAADPAKAGQEFLQLTTNVRSSVAGDLVAQFSAALRQRYGVQVHDDVLRTMKAAESDS